LIVVDTSAIIAIYLGEPDAARFSEAIESDNEPLLSAASLLECSIVMHTRKAAARIDHDDWLDAFILAAEIDVRDVTAEHISIARAAYVLYGKGMGNRAKLNFGDCFPYALAVSLKVPLLYKGADFTNTHIVSAL
jgi:ribonuclease VapC